PRPRHHPHLTRALSDPLTRPRPGWDDQGRDELGFDALEVVARVDGTPLTELIDRYELGARMGVAGALRALDALLP
ncbi:hypothetical protein ACBI99_28185, partial [Nonomuraea sp. ATR24]|uniref:hypothetical protein n=1 Tax=Nonomuraea sp. ATR24 TaxID=1676744 RepID=UPI0035BF2B30